MNEQEPQTPQQPYWANTSTGLTKRDLFYIGLFVSVVLLLVGVVGLFVWTEVRPHVIEPATNAIGVTNTDKAEPPPDLVDHETRGGLERGTSVGATPSVTLPTAQGLAASAGFNFQFIQSPNWSGRGSCGIEAIVLHVTGPGTLAGMDSWFKNPASSVSATFGIDKNGDLHQYVQLGDAAWHAGIVNRPDLTNPLIQNWNTNAINPNRCTVGIELVLGGPAEPLADYPKMQRTLTYLLNWLNDQTGVPLDRTHLIGHYQIDAVNRATDPTCCVNFGTVLANLNKPELVAVGDWKYDPATGDWYNPAGEREWSACNVDKLRWNYIVGRWFPQLATGGFDPLPTRNYWSYAGAC